MSKTWIRALVTGASSGIGESMARQLAADGTDLVLVARNAERMSDLGDSLAAAHNIDVEVLAADLSRASGVDAVSRRLTNSPRVDLLINNAGLGYTGEFVDIELSRHEEQLAVNIDALVRLSYAAASHMEASGGGTILNVSSIAGDLPGPKSAIYNATKAFVTSFSQSMHLEMADCGVVVSCLCPGLTRTDFQDRAGYDTSEIPDVLWQDADTVARVGLKAAASGKPVVTSGAINKTWSKLMRTAPRAFGRSAADALNRK